MNLFYQPRIPEGINYLDEEESRHCVKVLRKKEGELITITDGLGKFYSAVIQVADAHQCRFQITGETKQQLRNFSVHVAIAPTKNADRMEWFVEKSVELGIDRISLMECENSERTFIKTDRLKKVAISAMKQSLNARIPVIDDLIELETLIAQVNADQKFIAAVDASNPLHLKVAALPGLSYLILIGPEGDFSQKELTLASENNFRKVSLGASRLRTETAGIAACHILNLINEPTP